MKKILRIFYFYIWTENIMTENFKQYLILIINYLYKYYIVLYLLSQSEEQYYIIKLNIEMIKKNLIIYN